MACDITSGNPSYRAYCLICLVGGLDDVWIEVLHSREDGQCLYITSEPRALVASQFCAEKSCDIAAASHNVSAILGFLTAPSVTINSASIIRLWEGNRTRSRECLFSGAKVSYSYSVHVGTSVDERLEIPWSIR